MESETTLAKSLRAADVQARYDAACKRLLSEKMILAWIMKSCLDEYRDCDVDEIAQRYIEGQPQVGEAPVSPDEAGTVIRGMSGEDTTLSEGCVTYDIRFYALVPGSEEQIRLIINVEAQNDFSPGYPLVKRGIYYGSRMISAQYGTEFVHAQYQKLKKVYSIWVCMNPPKNRENTITRYCMTEQNLVGDVREPVQNYDLLSVIMLCLGGPDSGNYDGVLKLLDVLFSTEAGTLEKQRILQDDFEIPMTQTLEGGVSEMCNLSKGVWEKGMRNGMEKGRAEGLAEGRAEGRAEGMEKATLSSIRNLIQNTGWSIEQAMETLGIPEEQRQAYAEQLKNP